MDFTGQYSFASGHQPGFHQFMPVPPLTPSHSQSAPDEYNNSPPDAYDHVPSNDQFPNFDFPQGFHPQQPPQQNPAFVGHTGPPTPPSHTSSAHPHQLSNGSNGAFNGVGPMSGDMNSQAKSEPDDSNGGDDENMTPAQSKRKAQNRAAQRAFRERKERHVKDLEAKLADMEAAQQQSSIENERLKRDIQKITTENEILKATSTTSNGHTNSHSPEPLTTGPLRYSPTDFATNVLDGHDNKTFSHRIAYSKDGQRLLAAGASWDFIISHELFKRGLIDIGSVSDHLKTRAVCDGQGPVFSERDVLEAIELSVASGTDDLL